MHDFSIITPTYGRPASLAQLLHSITRLNYPSERFEVIVVDDGGSAPLEETVSTFRDRLDVRLFRQRNLGPAAARNYGAREAAGRYLAFTDDDCLPDANWLRELDQALQKAPTAVCGGRTTNFYPRNLPAQATQLLMDYLYENYSPTLRAGAFFPTNNVSLPRGEFLALGGFDEQLRFGEDREFCYRWRSRGGLFVYAPQAVVQHARRLSLGEFVHLHFLYGGGTARFRRACKRKGMKTVGFSSPLWYLGLLLYGVKREPGWQGVALSLLLLVSQAATLAGLLSASFTRSGGEDPGKDETHQL
jgi:GT2 family glycosyltransferase